MVTVLKTGTNFKLLWIQKKLGSIGKVDATPIFLSQNSLKECHFYVVM